MPPKDRQLDPPGALFVIGEDGQPYRIGTLGSLSLDESEDGTWWGGVGVTEWDAEIEAESAPWIKRIIYIIGARKQRKTALEKRNRGLSTWKPRNF